MAKPGSIKLLLRELTRILQPLCEAAESNPEQVLWYLHDRVPEAGIVAPEELADITTSLAVAYREFCNFTEGDPLNIDITRSIQAFYSVVEAIRRLGDLESFGNLSGERVVRKIIDVLIVEYLRRFRFAGYSFLRLLGVLQDSSVDECPSSHIEFSKLLNAIGDPSSALANTYKWGTAEFKFESLMLRLEEFSKALDIPSVIRCIDSERSSALYDAKGTDEPLIGADIPILRVASDGGFSELGFQIFALPQPNAADPTAIALVPRFIGSLAGMLELGSGWELRLSGTGVSDVGYGIVVAPSGVSVLQLDDGNQPEDYTLDISIDGSTDSSHAVTILGQESGSRLEIARVGVRCSAQLGVTNDLEIGVRFRGVKLVISIAEGDGFITKLLPGDRISVGGDFEVAWSPNQGIHFAGSAALEMVAPIHWELGPLSVRQIHLGIAIESERGLRVGIGVSVDGALGPVQATVDKIGFNTRIESQPHADGNAGPLDLNFSFLWPTGVGLAIEAGPIEGGGFLEIDDVNKRYAGILQLKMGDIGLTAIGLITTRMPDGSDGFALLVSIGVEFTPAIQISFGFTLYAVGGLVGINRDMLLDVLRSGIRQRSLDSVLFPVNPIENAPKIISDLRAVFPPEEDRFVVGPMLRIGWGSPNIITAELGVFIALPSPVRIAILGQFAAALPDEEAALIVLHLDVLGTIDFGKKTLAIDASLYDSRVLALSLSGDAALRLGWGNIPHFGISLGGFHPRFNRPPQFPALRRPCLSIGSGNNPRLSCEVYMALTSNSFQFGALVELRAKACGVKVHGYMGFDALFYFSPFGFDVSIKAGVSVSYKGYNLMAIRLYFQLSGTTPWHAEGVASVEFLWWDIGVHICKTWGRRDRKEFPAVDPWNDFVAALGRPESWGTTLPAGREMVESLRSLEREPEEVSDESTGDNGESQAEEPLPLLAHPAGTLEVRQKVLPLDLRLSQYGNAAIAGYHIYGIEPSGMENVFIVEDLKDYFPRSPYEKLSDTEKLSKPSYEIFKNGIAFKAAAVKIDPDPDRILACELKYESEYIDDEYITQPAANPEKARLAGSMVRHLLRSAASRKSGLRATGLKKYERKGLAAKVSAGEEGYTIVRANNMTAVTEIEGNNGAMSRMAADQALGDAIEAQPGLEQEILIVPTYEVAA